MDAFDGCRNELVLKHDLPCSAYPPSEVFTLSFLPLSICRSIYPSMLSLSSSTPSSLLARFWFMKMRAGPSLEIETWFIVTDKSDGIVVIVCGLLYNASKREGGLENDQRHLGEGGSLILWRVKDAGERRKRKRIIKKGIPSDLGKWVL